MNDKLLLELDFVLKVNTAAGRLLVSMEQEQGEIDFGEAWLRWEPIFKEVVRTELEKRRMGGPTLPEEDAAAAAVLAAAQKAQQAQPAAARPSERAGDVEEEAPGEGGEEEEPAPTPRREAPNLASLRERLKAKKEGAKKK